MTTKSHFQALPPNLIAYIVSFLNPLEETCCHRGRSNDRRGLLSLTATCKSLSAPALDRLWEQIPNLVPLVCSMPSNLWTLEELPSSSRRLELEKHVVKFVRPPVPADYMRFITYARRVKCLSNDLTAHFPRTEKIRTHPEVLSTLESFRPSAHLLPQIQDLSLALTTHTVGPVRALLSPKLEKLCFATHTTHDQSTKAAAKQATTQLFHKLGRGCPNLTQLTLDCSIRSKELRRELADALPNLRSLMLFVLKKPSVDMPLLGALSQLPNLRVLVIDCLIGDTGCARLPERPYLSFENLRMLTLNTDSMTLAYNLVCSVRSFSLQAVRLEIRSPASRSLVKKTLTQLAACHHELRHLKLGLPCAHADPPQDVLTSDTLRPLLPAKELITLDLQACPIAIDDQFLLNCDSWPNITTLRLGVRRGPGEPCSTVSLPALVPLVHKCTTLKVLGLPLDTAPSTFIRELRNLPPSLGADRSRLRLQTLQVGQAAITDVSLVSGYLSGLFPELLCIDTTCEADEAGSEEEDDSEEEEEEEARTANADRWEDVECEVPHFAAVRRQERAWAEAQGKRVVLRDRNWGAWDVFGLTLEALDVEEHRELQRFRDVVAGMGGWRALGPTGP
ncbi:hypothetical protein LXA43DRAFT_1182723 [Ganoderma leucocontextum]|nr:hypothetical protein LXA43DRAFT_1182723 [Ganoderma leucocontextum]